MMAEFNRATLLPWRPWGADLHGAPASFAGKATLRRFSLKQFSYLVDIDGLIWFGYRRAI